MRFGRITGLFFAALAVVGGPAGAETVPRIFWASDPVRPDETVMLHGSDLGASATVELARLEDGPASAPPGLPRTRNWTRVSVLQADDRTLKFVVPAGWAPGVFACRVTAGVVTTEPTLLNAPDPWWVQGNEGDAAQPGGWLRIMGKCLDLGGRSTVRLEPERGEPVPLRPASADGYCLRFDLPLDLAPGRYSVRVHNGHGGEPGWRLAGSIRVEKPEPRPETVFSVLDAYGPESAGQMRDSLIKYNQPVDRTEGILAALKRARENGGGVVYFPAGRYTVRGSLTIPDRTVLRGEGMGLVTLWWGTGHFNLDGGGPQGRERIEGPAPPQTLIEGHDFGIEEMSLYLPVDYEQAIVADRRFRMSRVRVRIDHYWLVQGRGKGVVARLGRNARVTDCDILAKGEGLIPGEYALIARNRILSNKSNTPMGGGRCVIVEDNKFVSMDPTAYQNISGTGRDIYYAHNRHEALYAQQSDYSFTFDAGTGAYLGAIAATDGTRLTLAADPEFPKWASEASDTWRHAAVFILDGRGAGQWRDVTTHHGRFWEVDRPFETTPDASSVASIVTFNGRVLIVGNDFEDANWVNAGYGTSVDVVCAGNRLLRCADLMNHGIAAEGHGYEPSWHVQYLDNHVSQGRTRVGSSGMRATDAYPGPLTRWAVHRRHALSADNSGGIAVSGNVHDVLVEGCRLENPCSTILADGAARGVLFRANSFAGTPSPRYEGDGAKAAVVLTPTPPPGGP